MNSKTFRIREEVAFRKADDGTMTIVSPVTDKIITINTSASEIWELIDGKLMVDEIKKQFISKHKNDEDFPGEPEAAQHVAVILEEFLERELIEQIEIKYPGG